MKFLENKKEFSIEIGNTVRVTDPCYSMSVNKQCVQMITGVLPGVYGCMVEKADLEDELWGDDIRVAGIEIRHTDYQDVEADELVGTAAVDSGMCGIFDKSYFARKSKDEQWAETLSAEISRRVAKENKGYRTFVKSSFYKPEFEDSLKQGYKTLRQPDYAEHAKEFGILDNFNKTIADYDALFAISVYSENRELRRAVDDYHDSNEGKKVLYTSDLFTSAGGRGIASESGVGDGCYDVYVGYNEAGQVVSIRLDYFGEDREMAMQTEEPTEER